MCTKLNRAISFPPSGCNVNHGPKFEQLKTAPKRVNLKWGFKIGKINQDERMNFTQENLGFSTDFTIKLYNRVTCNK